MIFRELTEKEFTKFEEKHEQASFSQTTSWGKLKEVNGWKHYYLGLVDNKKVVAATLLLTKSLPIIKKNMCYAIYMEITRESWKIKIEKSLQIFY